jgi:hypothetical protein
MEFHHLQAHRSAPSAGLTEPRSSSRCDTRKQEDCITHILIHPLVAARSSPHTSKKQTKVFQGKKFMADAIGLYSPGPIYENTDRVDYKMSPRATVGRSDRFAADKQVYECVDDIHQLTCIESDFLSDKPLRFASTPGEALILLMTAE